MFSKKDAAEKKRILADEYGMITTAELERRIQIMCNWSESVRERERIDVRTDVIEKMVKANTTKEQIIIKKEFPEILEPPFCFQTNRTSLSITASIRFSFGQYLASYHNKNGCVGYMIIYSFYVPIKQSNPCAVYGMELYLFR